MKHMASTLWLLSALVLLSGCGGGGGGGAAAGGGTSGPPSGPPPQGLSIAGNWEFNTVSTAFPGNNSTIRGSVTQSGSSVGGAVHVAGSVCFDEETTINFTGTLNGSNISLSSASIAGQILAFTGTIANSTLTGTYTINGGCANGDQGNVTGFQLRTITGNWNGTNDISDQIGRVAATFTQGNANADGSFGLSGTMTGTDYPVCDSGTISSGTLTTAGSWIIGTVVFIQIRNANGRGDFSGTVNEAGTQIFGFIKYIGGPCDGLNGMLTLRR